MNLDRYDSGVTEADAPDLEWVKRKAKRQSRKRGAAYAAGVVVVGATTVLAAVTVGNSPNRIEASGDTASDGGTRPAITSEVPDSTPSGVASQCGSEIPSEITPFPNAEGEVSHTGPRVEGDSLVDTYEEGNRRFEVVWPAPARQLRADNEDYEEFINRDLDKADSHRTNFLWSPEENYAKIYFGSDTTPPFTEIGAEPPEFGTQEWEDHQGYPWIKIDGSPSYDGACNRIQIKAFQGDKALEPGTIDLDATREALAKDGHRIFEDPYPLIVYSREVTQAPTKSGECDDPSVESEVVTPDVGSFEKPEEALLAYMAVDRTLISSGYIELIESTTRVVYVLGSPSLTDDAVTDFSSQEVLYVIVAEQVADGWTITQAKLPGC